MSAPTKSSYHKPGSESGTDISLTLRSETDAMTPGRAGPTAVTIGSEGISAPGLSAAASSAASSLPSTTDPAQLQKWAKDTITSGLGSGALPPTDTLTSALEAARTSDILETVKDQPLSSTGRAVVAETENLLESTQKLLDEKVKHDEVQQMLMHGAIAAQKLAESAQINQDIAETFGDDRAKLESAAPLVMRRMFEVTRMLVSAAEYRQLLQDIAALVSDWLQNASLAVIHKYAAVSGIVSDTGKAQDVASKEAGEAKQQQDEIMDRMRSGFKDIAKRLKEHPAWQQSVNDVLELFKSVRDHTLQTLGDQPGAGLASLVTISDDQEVRKHAEIAASNAAQLVENFGGDLEPLQRAVDGVIRAVQDQKPTVDALLDKTQDLINDPTNEVLAKDVYSQALALFKGVGVSDDKIEQAKATTQQYAQQVVQAGKAAADTVRDTAGQAVDQAKEADLPEQVPEEARQYAVEGGKEVASAAEEARQKFESTESQAKAQGDVTKDTSADETVQQDLAQLRDALSQLAHESQRFVASLRSDSTLQDVSSSLTGLMQAMFIDEQTGETKFKPELVEDLRRIVPALVQQLAVLPVARIDVSTDDVDVILDNLSLHASILPKDLTIVTETHLATDAGTAVNQIELKLRNVQFSAPDLVFYYYSKGGLVSFADVGIADVAAPGRGLDIDMLLVPSTDPSKLLRVARVESKVHELALNIRKSRHNWMYSILSPVVRRVVTTRLENALNNALTSAIESLDRAVEQAVATGKSVSSKVSTAASVASMGGIASSLAGGTLGAGREE
ncbi:hypothetical protein BCR44DRAFT_1485734 [Catenaria anguillulae PL171]|uniref:Uncharacterized protein n=1 Tax=Catenaria anguillulae PL171 TaxID=765915 RepID=A0A1Y2HJ84_9FUNG|nr:hypothetical protein BCR44DRAFT_1485734 [Catenaria anguillulae PL171]